MNIIGTNPVQILCDACQVTMKAGLSTAIVGMSGGEVRVYHNDPLCSGRQHQYLTAGAARTLTKTQLLAEIQTALGL